MNEEIKELRLLYEEEKKLLEETISNYIDEFEYKLAYYHSKRLKVLKQKIRLLDKFLNPNSDEIKFLEESKRIYGILPEGIEPNNKLSVYFELKKQEIDNKIALLKSQQQTNQVDGQEFDDLIYDLINDKFTSFRFYLNKPLELYLDYKKTGNSICINIPNYKSLKEKLIFGKTIVKRLKKIGFKKSKIGSLNFFIDVKRFKNSIEIKMITSRIIYDAIGYNNITNETVFKILD